MRTGLGIAGRLEGYGFERRLFAALARRPLFRCCCRCGAGFALAHLSGRLLWGLLLRLRTAAGLGLPLGPCFGLLLLRQLLLLARSGLGGTGGRGLLPDVQLLLASRHAFAAR